MVVSPSLGLLWRQPDCFLNNVECLWAVGPDERCMIPFRIPRIFAEFEVQVSSEHHVLVSQRNVFKDSCCMGIYGINMKNLIHFDKFETCGTKPPVGGFRADERDHLWLQVVPSTQEKNTGKGSGGRESFRAPTYPTCQTCHHSRHMTCHFLLCVLNFLKSCFCGGNWFPKMMAVRAESQDFEDTKMLHSQGRLWKTLQWTKPYNQFCTIIVWTDIHAPFWLIHAATTCLRVWRTFGWPFWMRLETIFSCLSGYASVATFKAHGRSRCRFRPWYSSDLVLSSWMRMKMSLRPVSEKASKLVHVLLEKCCLSSCIVSRCFCLHSSWLILMLSIMKKRSWRLWPSIRTQESCVCARVAPNAESLTQTVRSSLDHDCHMKNVCMPGCIVGFFLCSRMFPPHFAQVSMLQEASYGVGKWVDEKFERDLWLSKRGAACSSTCCQSMLLTQLVVVTLAW